MGTYLSRLHPTTISKFQGRVIFEDNISTIFFTFLVIMFAWVPHGVMIALSLSTLSDPYILDVSRSPG